MEQNLKKVAETDNFLRNNPIKTEIYIDYANGTQDKILLATLFPNENTMDAEFTADKSETAIPLNIGRDIRHKLFAWAKNAGSPVVNEFRLAMDRKFMEDYEHIANADYKKKFISMKIW